MFRRTKIVATIGPASNSPEMLDTLIDAGVNVFRLNFSHGVAEDHRQAVADIRRAATNRNTSVAILADLQGPKIRIGDFAEGYVTLKPGAAFVFDTAFEGISDNAGRVAINYPDLPKDCVAGDCLLLDDGLISLAVVEIRGAEVHCRVTEGGRLASRKGLNRLGGGLSADALTDKDIDDIAIAAKLDVDYLALSFPRDADDIKRARGLYQHAGGQGGVVAKIERAEAVSNPDNLDDMIRASDGVMVARGDLAVEIGDAELVGVQKHIILRARQLDRFVITATQMMESMIHAPQPTRAEVSDVANAVLDGTDAVMLSAETAIGDHPDVTVRAMERIILGAERAWQSRQSGHRLHQEFVQVDESIAMAAMYVANHLRGVKAIIAMTETGSTPRLMSRIRSGMPIFAFTPHQHTRRRMAIYRGVATVHFDSEQIDNDAINREAVAVLEKQGLIGPGDRIIITKGDYVGAHTGTNTMKIVEAGGRIR